MNEGFRLFVYGQLRLGGVGYQRLGLRHRTQWLGRRRIHGRLYDLGDYPGLILGTGHIVHGELLGFNDPALWAMLDDYEDCDPADSGTSEYRRLEVDLIGGGRAWVYEYARETRDAPLLPDEDWKDR